MRYNYPGLVDFEITEEGTCSLRFVIHSQSENFKAGPGIPEKIFRAKDRFMVGSWDYIEMGPDYLALHGRQKNREYHLRPFSTAEIRAKYLERALKAVEEWAASMGATLQSVVPEQVQLSLWD